MITDMQLQVLQELKGVSSFSLETKKIGGTQISPVRNSIGLRQNPQRRNELSGRMLLGLGSQVVSLPVEIPRDLARKIADDVVLNQQYLDYVGFDAALSGLRYSTRISETGVFIQASEGAHPLGGNMSIPYTIHPAFAAKAYFKEDRINGAKDEHKLMNGRMVRMTNLQDLSQALEIPKVYRLSVDFGGQKMVGWGLDIEKVGPIAFRDYKVCETIDEFAEFVVAQKRFMDPYFGITEEILTHRTTQLYTAFEEIAKFREESMENDLDYLVGLALENLLLKQEELAIQPPAKFVRVPKSTVSDEEDEVY